MSAPAAIDVKDPVCGMMVSPDHAVGQHTYNGDTYYLCGTRCLERFRANPEHYVPSRSADAVKSAPATSLPGRGEYTCPMHPEVRQHSAGSCPKCGMALEPVTPIAAATKQE